MSWPKNLPWPVVIRGTPLQSTNGWHQGQTVSVYIDQAIIGDRRSAVMTAFNNWSQSGGPNGSQVTYQFVDQPPPQNTGYTVLNQPPPSGSREETFTNPDAAGYTVSAITYLSPSMTNPRAVLEASSHGIGHPAGFGDCGTCAPNESVMATRDRYDNDNDVIGRATSPTQCDNEKLYLNNYGGGPPSLPAPGSGWIWSVYCCCWVGPGTPPPTPTPTPNPTSDPCDVDPNSAACLNQTCDICFLNGGAVCYQGLCSTPIVVDVQG